MAERDRLKELEGLTGPEATRALYEGWAETYDAELAAADYAAPARAARALAAQVADLDAPLLDIGCGTGVSGEAFRAAGFTCIDGVDFSDAMLAKARAKGLYRRLMQADLGGAWPFAPAEYRHMAAVGVLSPRHAPADLIDKVVAHLPSGGCFAFSFSDLAQRDPSYRGRLAENLDAGPVELLFREAGAHLPTEGLKAEIYVLRRR